MTGGSRGPAAARVHRCQYFVAGVVAAAVVSLVLIFSTPQDLPRAPLLLLTAGAALGSWAVVPLPQGGTQSISLWAIFAALTILGLGGAALVGAAGAAVGMGILRRRPVAATVFNAAQFVVVPVVVSLAYHLVGRTGHAWRTSFVSTGLSLQEIPGLMVSLLALEVSTGLLMSAAVATTRGTPFWAVYRQRLPWVAINTILQGGVGFIAALVFLNFLPDTTLFLAFSLAMLAYYTLIYTHRDETHRELAILQRVSLAVGQHLDLDEVLKAIADAVEEILVPDGLLLVLINHETQTRHVRMIRGGNREQVGDIPVPGIYEGVTGWVVRHSTPLRVEDYQRDPRRLPTSDRLFGQGFVRSALAVPMKVGNEVIGVFALVKAVSGYFTEHHEKVANALAQQAAMAIKNAQLYQEAQQQARRMETLSKVLAVVSDPLDLGEIYQRVVQEVGRTFGYPLVAIALIEDGVLHPVAYAGYPQGPPDMPVTRGVIGRVVRTGQPALVPDVTRDPDYVRVLDHAVSMASVPIRQDGRVVGALSVETDATRPLTGADLEMLQALSTQIGTAMRNATLYQEARISRDELAALYEAARAISAFLELQPVLDAIVTVACRSFGYEYGRILLLDETGGEFIVQAAYGYATAVQGAQVRADQGIVGRVARTGQPEVVQDITRDPGGAGAPPGVKSQVAFPLIVEGRVTGVFHIESARAHAFADRDLRVMSTLVSYATVAIQNARLYEEARRLAITDGLTGLYNHRYLRDALLREVERAQRYEFPLAVVMLEIDRFKHYNDTYGHLSGDEVLRAVAALLRTGSRRSDIVARYGGDEFVIVLPHTDQAEAMELAERLRRTVSGTTFLLGEQRVANVTLSAGVASFPDHGITADALIDAADQAMYRVKRSGGNRVAAS
ncbi:MAG: GAF domain-containing protein [Armatimonadetes bacterium]|nr:GAF domain-containing protein [Armatimonadota bacterium]